MSAFVIDASAILAAILGEPGGDSMFDRPDEAVVSMVNVAEVYTFTAMKDLPTEAIDAFYADTGITMISFDPAQAVAAGMLTADRPWQQVAGMAGVVVNRLR